MALRDDSKSSFWRACSLPALGLALAVIACTAAEDHENGAVQSSLPPARPLAQSNSQNEAGAGCAGVDRQVARCQALSPAAPHCINGIDCAAGGDCGELGWGAIGPIPWQAFGQGEYVGHSRLAHVPNYRLRVDDQLQFVYRVTRNVRSRRYRLEVGDELRVESLTSPELDRTSVVVQPDGTIMLRMIGQVQAVRRTFSQLTQEVEQLYKKYYRQPAITITPLKIDTRLEDLRSTINGRAGFGPQVFHARVTPEGTVALPAVGSVAAQGLTLEEFKRELDARYARQVEGMEVTPVLEVRAPRYCYVLGEVKHPGRFVLEGPTTLMQAIAMAGGWNIGGNLRQVVCFRRADDWRLVATMLDIRGALYGKQPCPSDEIWVNDSDVIVVPKSPILVLDDWISLVFTHGIYGVMPFYTFYDFSPTGTLITAN